MDVKKLLEDYNLTQQELADFTGIPRARIQKWIEKNIAPPKAHDLHIMQIAAKEFAKMPADKVKIVVKKNRILLNNVVPVDEYERIVVREDPAPYGRHRISAPITDMSVVNEVIGLLRKAFEESEKKWDRLLSAHEQLIAKFPDQK
jgi:transcriptional regulator with XRE-family HTH domain